MAKRILKIIGIVVLGFIVVTGGVVGIFALRGKFKEKDIPITNLYFEIDEVTGEAIRKKEIKTLDDIVINVKYEPSNATNTELIFETSDDKNYNIFSNNPETIRAGEDFKLKLSRDSFGNNVGGVETIIFKAGIVFAELKVIVDVEIPNNSIFFTGDNTGKITSSGKSFTMAISGEERNVYLKSQLVNAFDLKSEDENLKNVQIGYDYYDKKSGKKDNARSKVFNETLTPTKFYNASGNYYDSYYKIPITTDIAGTVEIWAKMHRTSEIERVFKESGFDTILEDLADLKTSDTAQLKLNSYNNFLNTYISYFDKTDESYDFFRSNMPTLGVITLQSLAQVKDSLDFVFVTSRATINVTAIKLDEFTSIATPRQYNVFDTVTYSLDGSIGSNIIEDFELTIITDNEEAGGVQEEKETMFASLTVNPYVYVPVAEIQSTDVKESELKWDGNEGYEYIRVYGFDNHTPVLTISDDFDSLEGYLVRLRESDEFVYIKPDVAKKQWQVSFNVPLRDNGKQGAEMLKQKALYLGFEISGIASDSINGEVSTKQSFTRIHIDYEDYKFTPSSNLNNIVINELMPYMTINTTDIQINEESDYYGNLATNRNVQDIYLDIPSTVLEADNKPTYQSVMYFVEHDSNNIVKGQDTVGGIDFKKVVTVGKYKFINYANILLPESENKYYEFGDEDEVLIGERIPTYEITTVDDGKGNLVTKHKYYIQALNASSEPVKIFAVVYLSDADGNPININGRKININEKDMGENIPELVVMRISEITDGIMPEVKVENFVDQVYFYTDSKLDGTQITENFTVNKGYINRNTINYFKKDGTEVSAGELKEIQNFLKLKLLKDNVFTLYISNELLDSEGNSISEPKPDDGEESDDDYPIYYHNNKAHAFNNLIADLDNYKLSFGGDGISVVGVPQVLEADGGSGPEKMIMFKIVSSREDDTSSNAVIYLDPTDSILPYSLELTSLSSSGTGNNQLQYNNHVEYTTGKLEVKDVLLVDEEGDYIDIQHKLQAIYSDISESGSKGSLLFYDYENSKNKVPYLLKLNNGRVDFDVITNLVDYEAREKNGDFPTSALNLNLIDCSQAVWKVDSSNEELELENGEYLCISDYINYYVKDPNNTKLNFNRTEGIMSFAQDFEFTNMTKDDKFSGNVINFGTKQFEVDIDKLTVNINGYVLNVEKEDVGSNIKWKLKVKQGDYFPMISGDKALIYNEIFTIDSRPGTNEYCIYDYVYIPENDNSEESYEGREILINKSAKLNLANGKEIYYDSSKYQEAVPTLNTSIVDGTEQIVSADLRFIQGEELAISTALQNGQQKLGVKVYLMLTFEVQQASSSETKYFYKAIEYELLQEEIDVVFYNTIGTGSEASINSNDNPATFEAGKKHQIYLGESDNSSYGSALSRIDIKATNEPNFFQHVDFSILSGEIATIPFSIVNDGKSIEIDLSDVHLTSVGYFTLQMKYQYKGTSKTESFYINVSPDIIFNAKDGVTDNVQSKCYDITLNGGNGVKYEIFNTSNEESLFIKYFEFDSDKIETIDLLRGGVVVNDDLTTDGLYIPGTSYAEYTGSAINYDVETFGIRLNLTGGKSIVLDRQLRIKINPAKVVDLTALDGKNSANPLVIYNGQNLFEEYIKLFPANSTSSDISNNKDVIIGLNNYMMFKVVGADSKTQGLMSSGLMDVEFDEINDEYQLKDGKILLLNTPTEDTELKFKVYYNELYIKPVNSGDSNQIMIEKEFTVVVKGVERSYKQDDIADNNGNITVNLTAGSNFDLSDYLVLNFDGEEESESSLTPVLFVLDSEGKVVDKDGNEIEIITIQDSIDTVIKDLAVGEYHYAIGYCVGLSGQGLKLIELLSYTDGEGNSLTQNYITVTINVTAPADQG